MSTTKVTDVTVQTTSTGLEVEITVRRSITGRQNVYPSPGDVPEDIRRALSVWLAGNQP